MNSCLLVDRVVCAAQLQLLQGQSQDSSLDQCFQWESKPATLLFAILEGFNIPLPGRDSVLRRSRVPDLSRGFGVASAILRLAAAVR